MITTQNLSITRGVLFETSVVISYQSNTTLWDLTDFSARGQIREQANSNSSLANFTCTISNGNVEISLPAETSLAILPLPTSSNPQRFVYDVEIYKALPEDKEEVYRILQGYVLLYPEDIPVNRYINNIGIYDFRVNQGSSFEADITVYEGNNVVDLTEYSARGGLFETASSPQSVLDFTCDILDPTNGKINVVLSPESSSSLTLSGKSFANPKKYIYRLELYRLVNQEEETQTILQGNFFITPEVTR